MSEVETESSQRGLSESKGRSLIPRKSYCYDYPRPAVTVDLALFALHGTELRVLMIRRKKDPYAGRWALPGGFMEIDEPIEDAARRELREETGYDLTGPLAFIGVFGSLGRDPRGRTISIAHAAVARGMFTGVAGADDAAAAAWLDFEQCRDLAFDHDAILATARQWLVQGVEEGPLGLALLPPEFDATQVRTLHRAIGKTPRSAQAWRSRMVRAGSIVPTVAGSNRYRSVAR